MSSRASTTAMRKCGGPGEDFLKPVFGFQTRKQGRRGFAAGRFFGVRSLGRDGSWAFIMERRR